MRDKRSLSVAWVDYHNTCDLIPHRWAICAPKPIRALVRQVITKWASDLCLWTADSPEHIPMEMKSVVFQGDLLSPLLFCLCVAPLSDALRETNGFRSAYQSEAITHLTFVDDLKVYGENKTELEEVVGMVEVVSGAMGMELGLRKCAVAHMMQGTMVMSRCITLKSDAEISKLEEGGIYHYLEVAQR